MIGGVIMIDDRTKIDAVVLVTWIICTIYLENRYGKWKLVESILS